METRTLRIWDGKAAAASDNCGHASEYKGFYIDDDKNNAGAMGTITWPVRRLGFIFDTKKACIVYFAQYVTSFNDPRPTDLVIDPKKDVMVKLRKDEKETKWLDSLGMFKVLAAWSTDPLKADPPRQQVPCQVRGFCKRDMNENEKLIFASIPRELPALAGRQRYSDEHETKNWEAKFDEKLTRMTGKFFVSLASGITRAISTKPEAALRNKNQTPSTEFQDYVFRRNGNKSDFWEIVFEGHKLDPVRHRAGMTYLHALLSQPGKDIAALVLYEIENPPPPQFVSPPKGNAMDPIERERYGTGGSRQTILDGTTPAQLKKAHDALEAKLTDPDLTERQREHTEDQMAAIDKALSNCRVATAAGGATFEVKQTKKCRQTVSAAIDSAIKALSKQSKDIVNHLKPAVRKGKICIYTANQTWKTR